MPSPEMRTFNSVGEVKIIHTTEAALSEWIQLIPSEEERIEAKLFARACLSEGFYLSVLNPELWSKSVDFTQWLTSAFTEGHHNVRDSLIMCGLVQGKGLYDLLGKLSLNSVLAEARSNIHESCFSYTRDKLMVYEKALGEDSHKAAAVYMRRKQDKKYIHSGVLVRDNTGARKLYMLHTYAQLPWVFATEWNQVLEIYSDCDHAIIDDYKSVLDFMSRHDIEQASGNIDAA